MALRLLAFEQASTRSIVQAHFLRLMSESQRPKLCCARARTPSGRPIVRHKDGLVLHAAARRRRRDTAASHCHRAWVCEYGPQHRPRCRKSLVVRGKGNAQFKRHLSQTSSTPFGASSQPSAQLYEHAHALPSDKAALASQVRTSPVGNGGAHGNGGSGGGGNGGGGAPPVIAKSYSVAAPHVGEA